jgi:hypothetical protein
MAAHIKALRWTVIRASAEFGMHRDTLTKYLRREGIRPGPDGKFSTQEIVKGVYGDLRTEQTRETRLRADKLEIELGKERKLIIPAPRVFSLLENIFVAVREKILGSHLSDTEKEQILNDLVSLRDADL